MSTSRTVIAAGILSIGSLIAAAPVANAQATCDWYGRQALKQQQENLERKCGFTGPEWNADMRAHLAWCGSVSPDESRRMSQKRDAALATCQPKK